MTLHSIVDALTIIANARVHSNINAWDILQNAAMHIIDAYAENGLRCETREQLERINRA